ncbi:sensor histidine kinase [Bacillus marasmi]|uniref:sensor histidine kinase n=1 Tax=Bacillus marasmi TaxID=1926279 RepID=UPI0011C7D37D|nr:HAMP domain-containing sensor histidine kinase [Bacillus marasmi]
MKKGIVLKLFLLTTALCSLILATIFIGQVVFFKGFYVERKTDKLKENMISFKENYNKNGRNTNAIIKMKDRFYEDHNSWITILDENGLIQGENEFSIIISNDYENYYGKAQNEVPIKKFTVPLYNSININEFWNEPTLLQEGMYVNLYGYERDETFIPVEIFSTSLMESIDNSILKKTFYVDQHQFDRSKDGKQNQGRPLTPVMVDYYTAGVIEKVNVPDFGAVSKSLTANALFTKKINELQAEILSDTFSSAVSEGGSALTVRDFTDNGIKYRLLIQPFKNMEGKTEYIFTMTSLQPLDEAIGMMKDYYVYLILFVLLLVLLAAFYYSKKIARPLLQINRTTQKIANLDFSEKLPITSNDEIGAISENINILSETLQSHIDQLNQDIEKERQLENTRKQFISGVSHELKTPLSVMQSCISILKDGVASHKKDYYFAAMEKEVGKMDRLIVDMLELAKLESGTFKIKLESFFINELIAYICKTLAPEMEKKDLQLSMDLPQVKVLADELRIEQVLANFMMNAIRHSPAGESIFVTVAEENERVKISIENTGVSIPESELHKVWDRFYRSDPSRQRSESQGGTGLGLSISKNILQMHQTEFGVTNTQKGVLFYFYLKLVPVTTR